MGPRYMTTPLLHALANSVMLPIGLSSLCSPSSWSRCASPALAAACSHAACCSLDRHASTSAAASHASSGAMPSPPPPAAATSSPPAVPRGKHTAVLAEASPSWPVQPVRQRLHARYRPWDTTRSLTCKTSYPSRMGFLIQSLEEEQVQQLQRERNFPDFRSGDVLEVRMLVPEVGRRLAVYKGVCIARYNKGIRSAFKLYNVFPDHGAVVQHIPLHMPDLVSIKVIGRVAAGSRVKKYHLLEEPTNKYSFQKQVLAGRDSTDGTEGVERSKG